MYPCLTVMQTTTTVISAFSTDTVVLQTMSSDIFSIFCIAVPSVKAAAAQHLLAPSGRI